MEWKNRITREAGICNGEPVIRGTRVLVRTLLESLAKGDNRSALLSDFPTITEDDLNAVIAFAASAATDDLPPRAGLSKR